MIFHLHIIDVCAFSSRALSSSCNLPAHTASRHQSQCVNLGSIRHNHKSIAHFFLVVEAPVLATAEPSRLLHWHALRVNLLCRPPAFPHHAAKLKLPTLIFFIRWTHRRAMSMKMETKSLLTWCDCRQCLRRLSCCANACLFSLV
jgi:hypothetical protein